MPYVENLWPAICMAPLTLTKWKSLLKDEYNIFSKYIKNTGRYLDTLPCVQGRTDCRLFIERFEMNTIYDQGIRVYNDAQGPLYKYDAYCEEATIISQNNRLPAMNCDSFSVQPDDIELYDIDLNIFLGHIKRLIGCSMGSRIMNTSSNGVRSFRINDQGDKVIIDIVFSVAEDIMKKHLELSSSGDPDYFKLTLSPIAMNSCAKIYNGSERALIALTSLFEYRKVTSARYSAVYNVEELMENAKDSCSKIYSIPLIMKVTILDDQRISTISKVESFVSISLVLKKKKGTEISFRGLQADLILFLLDNTSNGLQQCASKDVKTLVKSVYGRQEHSMPPPIDSVAKYQISVFKKLQSLITDVNKKFKANMAKDFGNEYCDLDIIKNFSVGTKKSKVKDGSYTVSFQHVEKIMLNI